jgi:ATP-dependent helicase/nuclease subunit A
LQELRFFQHLRINLTMTDASYNPVSIITASAGTGKTYDLVSKIKASVDAGVDPSRLTATTFTVKAADELKERVQQRFLEAKDADSAIRTLGARIGTVNSVSGGLIKEFAFALGRSPIVEVIDENSSKATFLQAAGAKLGECAKTIEPLSDLLGVEEWLKDVLRIVELARANNIASSQFQTCADRSIAGYRSLSTPLLPGETEAGLDQHLLSEATAIFGKVRGKKVYVGTQAALEEVRKFLTKDIASQPWQMWAKLSKLENAKADDAEFADLKKAASAFARHPRLFANAESYIRDVFACAAHALDIYDAYKNDWGLVDFVDQERFAYDLLAITRYAPYLRERLQSVFVDEFQDTSPLQLSIFVGMARFAHSSIWVGDPKQSIYRFRQTDPDLITYVAKDIQEATRGTALDPLDTNWRSRPGLVAFFNDAFSPVFVAHGLPEKITTIAEVKRDDLEGQSPPLAIWRIVTHRTKGPKFEASLVTGVLETLKQAEQWRVAVKDPVTDADLARPLRPGDIAILCRSNDNALDLADALAKAGLKVAIERDELLETLECRLAIAALRWCVDNRDTLALAELAHLLGSSQNQPAWFEACLKPGGREEIEKLVPIANKLKAIAQNRDHKTPLQLLDAVLGAGGVAVAVQHWGAAADRMMNLEALRGEIAKYEEERRRLRAPATASDLCAWLATREAKQPRSRSKDAITIITYHRSKGLEWPMVILTDLDDDPKDRPFGVHVASDVDLAKVDWQNPLAGRWLRLWPWPLGAQKNDTGIDVTAAGTPEGQQASRAEFAERARLLYVGATRARDYLVLAVRKATTAKGDRLETAWLNEFESEPGKPMIAIPMGDAATFAVGEKVHPVRVAEFRDMGLQDAIAPIDSFISPVSPAVNYRPLRIRPSSGDDDASMAIAKEIPIGGRLPLTGTCDMLLVGEAVHRFLAADDVSLPDETRLALAMRILDNWEVTNLQPAHVLEMSKRFNAFVVQTWPGAKIFREVPVSQRIGDQTMTGRIDALIVAPHEVVVVDHKSFPAERPHWESKVKQHAGQLRLYKSVIESSLAASKPIRLAIHLPISGNFLFVE